MRFCSVNRPRAISRVLSRSLVVGDVLRKEPPLDSAAPDLDRIAFALRTRTRTRREVLSNPSGGGDGSEATLRSAEATLAVSINQTPVLSSPERDPHQLGRCRASLARVKPLHRSEETSTFHVRSMAPPELCHLTFLDPSANRRADSRDAFVTTDRRTRDRATRRTFARPMPPE